MRMYGLCIAALVTFLATQLCLGSYTTIIDTGLSSNRVDMIIMGDGYTSADIAAGTYDNHIDGYLNFMFADTQAAQPFHRYRNFFNVHRIEVVSNESGADIPPDGIFRDTALDATYYYDGLTERLLYVDSDKANAARNAALSGAGFLAEMQYITVNETKYGGGGASYAVFAGGNSSASQLALHEIAHSFSGLADEYGGDPGPYTGPEPGEVNLTKDPTGAKWSRWHGYDQPGIGVIGAYEGGGYYDAGIYRPSNNSKMRSLSRPFDAVSREKIILDIYDLVDPLDAWRDNSSPLTDPGDLYVDPVDDSVIDIEWFVDGNLIPAAVGDTFDPADYGYGAGSYVVQARGYDPTGFDPVNGWVRMDESKLEQYVHWFVTLTGALAGDLDGDGFVGLADLDLVLGNWNQTVPPGDPLADVSGPGGTPDGFIGLDDLDVVLDHWNAGTPPGDAAAIPEPTTALILMMGLSGALITSPRRQVN